MILQQSSGSQTKCTFCNVAEGLGSDASLCASLEQSTNSEEHEGIDVVITAGKPRPYLHAFLSEVIKLTYIFTFMGMAVSQNNKLSLRLLSRHCAGLTRDTLQ